VSSLSGCEFDEWLTSSAVQLNLLISDSSAKGRGARFGSTNPPEMTQTTPSIKEHGGCERGGPPPCSN
jgi:hypothetical protein